MLWRMRKLVLGLRGRYYKNCGCIMTHPHRDSYSIHIHAIKILVKQVFGGIKLGRGIFLYTLQLVFLAHGFVLVDTEGMIGEDFNALNHLVVLEVLAQSTDVFLGIADARHEDITHPERQAILDALCPRAGHQQC